MTQWRSRLHSSDFIASAPPLAPLSEAAHDWKSCMYRPVSGRRREGVFTERRMGMATQTFPGLGRIWVRGGGGWRSRLPHRCGIRTEKGSTWGRQGGYKWTMDGSGERVEQPGSDGCLEETWVKRETGLGTGQGLCRKRENAIATNLHAITWHKRPESTDRVCNISYVRLWSQLGASNICYRQAML